MTTYPLSIPGTRKPGKPMGEPDTRYAVAREGTEYVLRFEGEEIARSISRGSVILRASGHRSLLNGQEPIVEVRPGDPRTS